MKCLALLPFCAPQGLGIVVDDLLFHVHGESANVGWQGVWKTLGVHRAGFKDCWELQRSSGL